MLCFADASHETDCDEPPPAGAEGCREDEPSLADICRDALIAAGFVVGAGSPEAGALMLVPSHEPARVTDRMIVGFASGADCLRAWRALKAAGVVVTSIGSTWIEAAWPGDVLEEPLVADVMARRAA